ncbi:MAG: PD-(D/E)XK nuclease family protein [Planctomycetia bacterium]|nr:PD-(D/E)XK nuclease family protein [Planctomycetia bacterium]
MTVELLDFKTRDEPAGVWDYVSPSRLNLWLKCPLAFKLRYIDGVVTPTSPAMFVGRMVHQALECFYRHRQIGLAINAAELKKRLTEAWGPAAAADKVAFKSQADEQTCSKQASDLVTAYLAHLANNSEPHPLAVETSVSAPLVDPMTGEDLGIPLVGVVDLVLAKEPGPLIVDFKTTSRSTAPLAVTHEVQLGVYAYLVRHALGRCESGLEIRQLVKTKTVQVAYAWHSPRSPQHTRRLFEVIRAYLDDLDRGRFVFRPGLACQSCEYRDEHCRRWCA